MSYANGKTATSGFSLDGRALRHLDARQKACLAANVLDAPGSFRPSANLLAHALHVSLGYIAAARGMSPAKRAAILAGTDNTSFTLLLHPPKAPLALPAPSTMTVADSVLAEIVRANGVARVLDAAVLVESNH
jgi:hypothetical protein